MGKKPILSPTEMPIMLFRMRIRKIAMSKERQKRSVTSVNVSSLFLTFSTILPRKKDPKASRMSQLARIMPMENSLPEKMIRNSLKRSISATNPLNPIVITAIKMRFFIRLNLIKRFQEKRRPFAPQLESLDAANHQGAPARESSG